MKKSWYGILLMLALTVIAACNPSLEGKFVSEKNPRNYRELRPDKTYFVQEEIGTTSGTYEINADSILFRRGNDLALTSKLHGTTIVDPDGEVWKKQ